jgi:hypothetical protein
MRARTLAMIWLALGVALWCGIFDIYISRGATDYLRAQAQYELRAQAEAPSMDVVMTRAKRAGALAASLWASAVVGLDGPPSGSGRHQLTLQNSGSCTTVHPLIYDWNQIGARRRRPRRSS